LFQLRWIERRHENGALAATSAGQPSCPVVQQPPGNEAQLQEPPGIYGNGLNCSRKEPAPAASLVALAIRRTLIA